MKFLLGLLVLMPIVVFGAILILLDSPELYRTQLTATVRQATGHTQVCKDPRNHVCTYAPRAYART